MLDRDVAKALSDRYAVERELGAGGMATVYLARDLKHERSVAIKLLHADIAEWLGSERFLREIRLAAALSHPHILPLFDSGEAATSGERGSGAKIGEPAQRGRPTRRVSAANLGSARMGAHRGSRLSQTIQFERSASARSSQANALSGCCSAT